MENMSTVRIPRVGADPCAGLRGGCPISVDPVESGTLAPSWMGSGGEWTPWRQFGARTELARLRVVSPPEQKLLSLRLRVSLAAERRNERVGSSRNRGSERRVSFKFGHVTSVRVQLHRKIDTG